MKTNTLTSELLCGMHSYWRAANYLSVGQIYLYDNPLLRDPLKLSCEAPVSYTHLTEPRFEGLGLFSMIALHFSFRRV